MSKYEAILFDFGGVLTDNYSEDTYPAEIAGKFGVPQIALQPFLRANKFLQALSLGKMTEQEVIRRVTAEFPEAHAITPREITSSAFVPSKGAMDAVRRLRDRSDMKLAIGSNIFPSSREILRDEPIEALFDKLYYSCEMGMRKPELRFFEFIAEDMQIDPNKILFLDDLEINIAAAMEVGYDGHLVTGSSAQTASIVDSL